MFHAAAYSARCFLEVAAGSVDRSKRTKRSASGSRLRKLRRASIIDVRQYRSVWLRRRLGVVGVRLPDRPETAMEIDQRPAPSF
jgi:hypothetical protein